MIFKDHINDLSTIKNLEEKLDQWKLDFEMHYIKVVKIPDIY